MSGLEGTSDYHDEFDKQTLSIDKQRAEDSPAYLLVISKISDNFINKTLRLKVPDGVIHEVEVREDLLAVLKSSISPGCLCLIINLS